MLDCQPLVLVTPLLINRYDRHHTVAVAFGRRGANVYISGRNAQAAAEVLAKCRAASYYQNTNANGSDHGGPVYEFHSFDAVSIKDCKRFAGEMLTLLTERGGLDVLVMTQGAIGNGERRETQDGHEW